MKEADATSLLYVAHRSALVRYAARIVGSREAAEDIVQEAMLRLWRIAADWRTGEAKVSTWLYRVTANLCTDRLRRRRSVALDSVAEPEDGRPGVEAEMMAAERAAALEAALARLPERQRQAVVLRHLDGLANPEIAEIMGVGVEAVESLTSRGKRALSALLGREGALADLNADLCARLRSGEMDAATPGLLAALRANAADQIAIDQPTYAPEPR